MNLRKKIILGLTIASISSIASAYDFGLLSPTGIYEGNSTYESSLGNKYQYDLSNPVDSIRYDVDPTAQIKDSVSVRRDMDISMGEYGGGIIE